MPRTADTTPADETPAGRAAAGGARVAVDEATVRAHQAAVWRYLRYLGCAPDDADDLTQETFVVLADADLPDRGPAALRGWLRGTALNLCRTEVRRARRNRVLSLPVEQIEAAWVGYESDDDGAGYRAALRECLGALPDRERAALEQRYGDARSRADVAGSAGVGLEGVKSLLRRAKARLRACIERKVQR